MKDAGYIYVNIDDCWQGTRDEQRRIQPNEKFGDMKALVNYVHAKGLKIGIYSSLVPKRLFATAPLGTQRVVIRADSEIGVVRPEFHGHFLSMSAPVFTVVSGSAV